MHLQVFVHRGLPLNMIDSVAEAPATIENVISAISIPSRTFCGTESHMYYACRDMSYILHIQHPELSKRVRSQWSCFNSLLPNGVLLVKSASKIELRSCYRPIMTNFREIDAFFIQVLFQTSDVSDLGMDISLPQTQNF